MKPFFLLLPVLLLLSKAHASDAKSLGELLLMAYGNNPAIKASRSMADVEDSLITSVSMLDDPVIGIATLDRNVRTQYGVISQKIRFPVKYFLQRKAQSGRAKSFKSKLEMTRLSVRQQVISLYYSIYSMQNIIQLTEANIQAVQEFARIAEKKYAAGKSPQGDSMKAHFELTQLQLELIRLKQEEESLQDKLKAAVNRFDFSKLKLSKLKLAVPKFRPDMISSNLQQLTSTLENNSPTIKMQAHALKEAKYKSSLAKWEYMPDFQLQYQKRIAGKPSESKIYSVGITFPLWFWKKGFEASAASSKKLAREFMLADTIQKMIAKVKDLRGKVQSGVKTLNIYATSLIPQAEGAYNSSRASYRANKTSFLDLLDSERSLYRVRTGFFKSLRKYVHNLTQLETHLGFDVSDLEAKHGAGK